jgi:hypothetical protein
MKLSRWIVLAGLGVASVGCANKNKMEAARPEVDDVKFGQVRTDLMAASPNAVVGRVMKVDGKETAAEIGDLSADVLRANDTVLIIKDADTVLASGTVFHTEGNSVMVRYNIEPGGRAPMKGDIAVHMPLNSMRQPESAMPSGQ